MIFFAIFILSSIFSAIISFIQHFSNPRFSGDIEYSFIFLSRSSSIFVFQVSVTSSSQSSHRSTITFFLHSILEVSIMSCILSSKEHHII